MKTYGQFCPVAQTAEILTERWTPLVIRELLMGSTRFNDLRRGVPLMSSSLLSQRLKTLEMCGIVVRDASQARAEYTLTEAGKALKPLIEMMGAWGYHHAKRDLTKAELDPSLLMWDVRRRVDASATPPPRTVARFEFAKTVSAKRRWWLVISDGETDLCLNDPGHALDLNIKTDVRTLTNIWLGRAPLASEVRKKTLQLEGKRIHVRAFAQWFSLSVFSGLGLNA